MEDKIYKYLKKNKNKEIYQCNLKDVFNVTLGTISKFLSRLEKDGKIKREVVSIPTMEDNFIVGCSFEKMRNTKKIVVV